MTYLVALVASFAFIFLRAFQQRNVAFDNYAWVIPVSWAMAATEFLVVTMIAKQDSYNVVLVLTLGSGAGMGSLTAMLLHKRFVKK